MKKTTSMRRAVLWSILVVTGLVLASYTVLLLQYFEQGMMATIKADMHYSLHSKEEQLFNDAGVLRSIHVKTSGYDVYSELPESLESLLTNEHLEVDKLTIVQEQRSDGIDPTVYLLMPYRLQDGQVVFVVDRYKENQALEKKWMVFGQALLWIIPIGIGFLALILVAVIRLGRRLSRPTDRLAGWADHLTLDNYSQPRPDFSFQELNRVADRLQGAFTRIGGFMEREHAFLRHASHELRTPVAVVKANVELMKKRELDPAIAMSLERIDRSAFNMQQMIETLLWLSREDGREIVISEVNVDDMLSTSCEELSFLLKGKPVDYVLQTGSEPVVKMLPAGPFQILVNNLLRNAFQHTFEGEIIVRLHDDELEVENREYGQSQTPQESDDSFGIGLELVHLLSKKMNWQVRLEPGNAGFKAVFSFA